MNISKKTSRIIFIIILIVAALTRLAFLDRIPIGINDDELHFVLNSKSIFYNLKNINGNRINLFSFEASSLLFAPILGLLPTNLFTARLPYALIGILSIFLIFKITFTLTKNYNLALITALVTAINPWSIYVSRTSFDAPVAIFFFLLCLFLMIRPKPKYILLSIVPGFLAFNSYIGTKIIYFPFVFLSAYFLHKFFNKKYGLQYFIVVLFSFLITVIYSVLLPNLSTGSRINELLTPNSQKIVDQVNLERRQSLQSPLKPLITNKYTVYTRNFIDKYLYSFSTDILFLNGDHAATGSLWKHGYFYYLDSILLILGIIYLYKNYLHFLILISVLLLLSPIPEAVRSDLLPAYVFHSSLQFPLLCIFVASGILFFWQTVSNKYFRLLFIFAYVFSFINFLDIYFFKAPIYQSESFPVSSRIISKYISLETKNNRQIYFLTRQPEVMFRNYLFYTNSFKKSDTSYIDSLYLSSRDNIHYQNVHFINTQEFLPNTDDYILIYDTDNFIFYNKYPDKFISRLSDAGKIYSIYQGSACQDTPLETFTHNLNLLDLKIENLSQPQFCQKFITL